VADTDLRFHRRLFLHKKLSYQARKSTESSASADGKWGGSEKGIGEKARASQPTEPGVVMASVGENGREP
jgi:hypothetical protein